VDLRYALTVAGFITAVACGGSSGGSSPTAPSTVVNTAPTVTHHTIVATPSDTLEIGEITTLTITAHYNNGSELSSPATCNPESGQSLTITADCVLTAVGGGSGTFNLSSPTGPISITITVLAPCCKVAGWIRGFGLGEWVENATVSIGGSASTTTNAEGYFELQVDQAGTLPVVIEASEYHRSESELTVERSKMNTYHIAGNNVKAVFALRDLLPTNPGYFDLNFYDHIIREKGARSSRRWVTMPTVEVYTKTMKCLETDPTDNDICTKYEATATAAPSSHLAYVESIASADIPLLTADVLNAVSVTTKSHATGTIITEGSCNTRDPNKIVALYITKGSSNFSGQASYALNCSYASGAISSSILHFAWVTRDTHLHEVAHSLGWGHPDGYYSIPRRSVMDKVSPRSVTSWDKQAGRVLYKERRAGHLTPDKDSPGNTINYPKSFGTFTTGHTFDALGMPPTLFTDNSAPLDGRGLFQGPLTLTIER